MAFMHVAVSSDEVPSCGEMLACVSGGNGTMRLYDLTTMLQMYEFSGHGDAVNMCTFNLTCDLLASASDDCTLRLWRPPQYDNINRRTVEMGACVAVLRGVPQGYANGHSHAVTQCDFTPDGLVLVSASDDKSVKTWDIRSALTSRTGHCLRTLTAHTGWVTAICCSPLHSHLISGGDDGIIILWDVGVDASVSDKHGTARAKLLGTQVAHDAPIQAVTFSHDGRFAASAAADSTLLVFHVSSMSLFAKMARLPASPMSLSFDRDAWRLWILTDEGRLLIYPICDTRHEASPVASPVERESVARERGAVRAVGPAATGQPLGSFFLPRMSGGKHFSVSPQSGNSCLCVGGDGSVLLLKVHNAVHTDMPPPTPVRAPCPGTVRIKDDADDTEEIEWEEFSGPVGIAVERIGGSDGRVSVHFSTRGTNDDDPDFVAAEGILEWDHGDAQDKVIWLAMRSYNGMEWDAQAHVVTHNPDTASRLLLQARLAEFGGISFAEGYVAHTRPWHPPLLNNRDYRELKDDLEDAVREDQACATQDDERLVAARNKLKWALDKGADADVGLTNWTGLSGKMCVLDPDCVPGAAKEGWADPEERRRRMSHFVLDAAKRAQAAGAVAVVVPVPRNADGSVTLDVLRVPLPDVFDEITGKWDADAMTRDKLSIPVVSVAPAALKEGEGATAGEAPAGRDVLPPGVLRPGTQARVVPEAVNFSFYQRTGIKPKVYLDMVGDTDFEVVLLRSDRCALDPARASATVRIVTREAMRARLTEGVQKQREAMLDKEEGEAAAAEAVAIKERQEADEAEAHYAEELREAAAAERHFEEVTLAQHAAEEETDRLRAAAEAREAQADRLQQQCMQGREKLKETLHRLRELKAKKEALIAKGKSKTGVLASFDRLLSASDKLLPGGGGGEGGVSGVSGVSGVDDIKEVEEQLKAVTEAYRATAEEVEEAAAELDLISNEMDEVWQLVEEAQVRAEQLHAQQYAAEIAFRKEKAELDLARVRRDKEVAEAEEAEANARRERAEAEQAKAAAQAAQVAAAAARESREREEAKRRDFERLVAEAADAMARSERDRLTGAAEAAEAAARAQRHEREQALKAQAAEDEKRMLEAEEQARLRELTTKRFNEAGAQREAELHLQRMASTSNATSNAASSSLGLGGLDSALDESAQRFPWRRERFDLEPGFTRNPRPALSNDFMHVVKGWDGDNAKLRKGKSSSSSNAPLDALDKRVQDASQNLPLHLRKAATASALELANGDYLQALNKWDDVDDTSILEGDTLKLGGRAPPHSFRESLSVSLADAGPMTNTRHASLVRERGMDSTTSGVEGHRGECSDLSSSAQPSRLTTPASTATGAQFSRKASLQSTHDTSQTTQEMSDLPQQSGLNRVASKVKFLDDSQ